MILLFILLLYIIFIYVVTILISIKLLIKFNVREPKDMKDLFKLTYFPWLLKNLDDLTNTKEE